MTDTTEIPLIPIQPFEISAACWYAQLDTNGVCSGISMLAKQVFADHMIPIEEEDLTLLGKRYDVESGTFLSPEPSPVPADPCEWLIDPGSFYDRFGAAKWIVLAHQDPIISAMVKDISVRPWVDLRRSDVAMAMRYLAGGEIPGIGRLASPIPGVTAEAVDTILHTPVTPGENHVLRTAYFS